MEILELKSAHKFEVKQTCQVCSSSLRVKETDLDLHDEFDDYANFVCIVCKCKNSLKMALPAATRSFLEKMTKKGHAAPLPLPMTKLHCHKNNLFLIICLICTNLAKQFITKIR